MKPLLRTLRVLSCLALLGAALSFATQASADPPKSTQAKVALWIYEASKEWIPISAVGGWENKEQADVRRLAIATDIVDVAFDPDEKPVFTPSSEPDGDYRARVNTAIYIAAIAKFESGYDVRVDTGHCEAFPGGIKAGWCDNGNAHSLWQHNIGNGKTADGWGKVDLIADRKKAIRAAQRALRASAKACGSKYSGADAHSAYAQGFCGPSAKMRERFDLSVAWTKSHPPPTPPKDIP